VRPLLLLLLFGLQLQAWLLFQLMQVLRQLVQREHSHLPLQDQHGL
jgi:hypothetical protein